MIHYSWTSSFCLGVLIGAIEIGIGIGIGKSGRLIDRCFASVTPMATAHINI